MGLLAMSIAGALSMDIMSLQIRLVILNAYRNTVNLQSINAALTITVMESTEAPAIHVEVIFVQIIGKIAVLLAMSIAGALSMDIMSLQIRLEHLVILLAYRNTVNLQSINAALTITLLPSTSLTQATPVTLGMS